MKRRCTGMFKTSSQSHEAEMRVCVLVALWLSDAGRLAKENVIMNQLVFTLCILFISSLAPALGQDREYRKRFEVYVEPRVPAEFYVGERFLSVKLTAGIAFDQRGKPKGIRFGHVIEERGLPYDDPLWPAMERAARSAIEQWRVKLRLWTAEEVPDSTERAFMNSKPTTRPDHGYQYHLVVFHFIRGISDTEIRDVTVLNVEVPEEH